MDTLYKLSTTGKLLQWDIRVEDNQDGTASIVTDHGQVGGKIQTTSDLITGGKNIGKANETTVQEQANKEALSKWKKQFDKDNTIFSIFNFRKYIISFLRNHFQALVNIIRLI